MRRRKQKRRGESRPYRRVKVDLGGEIHNLLSREEFLL